MMRNQEISSLSTQDKKIIQNLRATIFLVIFIAGVTVRDPLQIPSFIRLDSPNVANFPTSLYTFLRPAHTKQNYTSNFID